MCPNFRALIAADRPLLRRATLANMNWSGPHFSAGDVDASDEINHYFRDFPGGRDIGLADVEGDTVRAVAWLVFLPADSPGYGFGDADTPELSITTFDGFRGQGVGTALLGALVEAAKARGVRAISLSVEDGNRARHLYERTGFTVVGRNGGSDTMLLTLH
ncbi:MAG: GNAT family N-acetyltransferase [Cryobacterium sp.]|nr:GNAT family N-acetyltransferase [Cryobacterium sp.]